MASVAATQVSFKDRIRIDRRQPTVQQIYQALRAMIIELTLPPGATISKGTIAKELGVSPTPVREALLRLQDDGLVDIYPQSKTAVSLIDVQDAHEAQFLRLSVEVEIVRRLAGAPATAVRQSLRRTLDRQHRALERSDLTEFAEADQDFHRTLYEHANVAGLWSIIHSRRAHIDRLRRLHLPLGNKRSDIMRDHERIYDALAAADPEMAEEAVRTHLSGTLANVDALMAEFPDYFEQR